MIGRLDWRLTPLNNLNHHRFEAHTMEGQTLTGWLCYEPEASHGPTCFDADYLTEILIQHRDGINRLTPTFTTITVYKDVRH